MSGTCIANAQGSLNGFCVSAISFKTLSECTGSPERNLLGLFCVSAISVLCKSFWLASRRKVLWMRIDTVIIAGTNFLTVKGNCIRQWRCGASGPWIGLVLLDVI